jgi:hypothetical protein
MKLYSDLLNRDLQFCLNIGHLSRGTPSSWQQSSRAHSLSSCMLNFLFRFECQGSWIIRRREGSFFPRITRLIRTILGRLIPLQTGSLMLLTLAYVIFTFRSLIDDTYLHISRNDRLTDLFYSDNGRILNTSTSRLLPKRRKNRLFWDKRVAVHDFEQETWQWGEEEDEEKEIEKSPQCTFYIPLLY